MATKANTKNEKASSNGKLAEGWRIVKFGDVVREVKETVDRETTTLERYVAGGHMDSDDFHLRRWGEITDDYLGPAFHRLFKKGQILYGSRRTYLKKVAVAPFEGITANTTFVLESRDPQVFLPDLVPHVMLSDSFTTHAISKSRGSTNPYVVWKDIAEYQFLLPPPERQSEILRVLFAVVQVSESVLSIVRSLLAGRAALVEEILNNSGIDHRVPILKLLMSSPSSGYSATPARHDTGFYVLSLSAVSYRGYISGNLKPINPTEKSNNARLSKGDLLISRSNTVELVGLTGIFNEDRNDVCYPDTMMLLPVDESQVSAEFLEMVLLSRMGRRHMRRVAAGTSGSMKKINRKTLGEFHVPTPSLDGQEMILEKIRPFTKTIRLAELYHQSTISLRKSLAELLLAPGLGEI